MEIYVFNSVYHIYIMKTIIKIELFYKKFIKILSKQTAGTIKVPAAFIKED